MNYKIIIYVFTLFLTIYSLSALNINNIIKSNKVNEARVFLMLLALSISYLVTNFIYEFTNIF